MFASERLLCHKEIHVNHKKHRVLGCIEGLLKFETAFTVQEYLQIFSCATPLSKCLQTVQLDLLTVHRMNGQLVDNMQKKRDDFQVCHDSTAEFVQWVNAHPYQLSKTDVDLIVEESLPIRRQRRRKCVAGELSIGEVSSTSGPVKKHRREEYNRIHFYAMLSTFMR